MNPVAAAEWAVRLIGTGMGKRHHPGPTATLLSDEDLKLEVDRLLGLQPSRRSYLAKAAPDESDGERDEERDVDGAGEEGPATAAIRAQARARHRRADEEPDEPELNEGDEPEHESSADEQVEFEKDARSASDRELRAAAEAGSVAARLELHRRGVAAVHGCLTRGRFDDPSHAAWLTNLARGLGQ